MDTKIPRWAIEQRRSLPLDCKIKMADLRIRQWYEHWHGRVYVAFSGGKDSGALLHLVRRQYSSVPAVFFNTGLEFPEVVDFVRSTPNVTWVKPKLTFRQVLNKYGYPFPSKEQAQRIYEARHTKSDKLRAYRLHGKHSVSKKFRFVLDAPFEVSEKCCSALKKRPAATYVKESGRHGILGTMAIDSFLRTQSYMRYGCNAFSMKSPVSRPLSVWTEDDVWAYIRQFNVPYSSIYDMGYRRTGCIFCMFGIMRESPPNRFQRLKQTHPKLWNYCMDKLNLRQVLEFANVPYE